MPRDPTTACEAARSAFGLTGAGADVCVLDTGVDPAHEQLDSKSIVWSDFIDGVATPYDDHGHGTHVASIAVGDGVGGSLAARFGGVAPAAGLFAGKVLDAEGSGDESGIVAGIEWCAADPDVDVISMSLGTLLPSDGSDVLSLAANAAVADGKIVVVAAGNSGDAPDTIGAPGAAADAITVGAASEWSAATAAANHSDGIFLAYFSSRGGETFAGDMKPDIVAPGVTIRAANANTASGYVVHSGTSMATPFAAGSIALALQAAPAWSSDQVQGALEATAEDFGPPGKDQDWGAGLLDVLALTAEAEGQSGATSFPRHVHVSGVVPDGGEWTYAFDLAAADLGVPIAASIVSEGEWVCQLEIPDFGCLDGQWSPDLDAELVDPDGDPIALSQCMDGAECGSGRQETLHAMPTVAGTYQIRVYAFLGAPNDGLGGGFELDLSTGPAGDGAAAPTSATAELGARGRPGPELADPHLDPLAGTRHDTGARRRPWPPPRSRGQREVRTEWRGAHVHDRPGWRVHPEAGSQKDAREHRLRGARTLEIVVRLRRRQQPRPRRRQHGTRITVTRP